jgi:membrane-associated phospholipid phosphatase
MTPPTPAANSPTVVGMPADSAAAVAEARPPLAVATPPTIAEVVGADRAWWRAGLPRRPWAWLSLFVIACGWDRAAYLAVKGGAAAKIEAVESLPFQRAVSMLFSWRLADALGALQYFGYHAIKSFGTVWVSAAVAAALVIGPLLQPDTTRVRAGLRRGVLMFLAPATAGLIAEALKLITRRQRPEFADGHMSFRLENFWSTSGLGLPSSHAAVAAAGAMVLAILWPRWRWVWVALGTCCVLGRVLSGAHFVSDAVLGVLAGLCAGRAVIALDLENNRGVAVPG